jgi:anti-sigma regulatory factor (Ser/Thr protein kinase)
MRRKRRQLESGPKAPAEARDTVVGWLAGATSASALEDVKLLVSELVTNAVRHPDQEGPIELELSVAGEGIRIAVSDPGEGFTKPTVGPPPPDALGGRGLLIVDRLASRWGVDPGRPTRVWFELDAT